ncbi:hypothetical protein [Aurantibacter sp.]|uniref:hypothetical protein n=1 Tax=Aurantibacter sp. TaxID=2807103 RepID=UPI0032677E66
MVYFKHIKVFIIFFLSIAYCYGQSTDCTLDIGGETANPVVEIFQLNDVQKQKLEELRAKYSLSSKSIDDEIAKLLAEHPQSTPEELLTLAKKYRVLQLKLMQSSRDIDEELIATFNQRQYDFYLTLCHEAVRKPIVVNPVIYEETLVDEK